MLKHKKILFFVACVFILGSGVFAAGRLTSPSAHHFKPGATPSQVIRYLPLGDSYTIGQSVAESERWPNQLAAELLPNGLQLQIITNPSVTGYTTQDLIDKELPLVAKYKPDFVTVLIGVNDYVHGVNTQTFEEHFQYIIAELQKQLSSPEKILVITIPDYAKTPTGSKFGDPIAATQAISNFNEIIKTVAARSKIRIADIFAASQQVSNDPELTASDGLHPSGKQYQIWTQVIKKSL